MLFFFNLNGICMKGNLNDRMPSKGVTLGFQPRPDQGDDPPGPRIGGSCLVRRKNKRPLLIGSIPGLVTLWLLARRRSRPPGCKASGESKENPEGESSLFPLRIFLAFLGPEAYKLSVPPVKLAKEVFSAKLAISPKGVQGPWPLVQVHEGRRGPRPVVPFVVFYPL